jgi:hypothetical protein
MVQGIQIVQITQPRDYAKVRSLNFIRLRWLHALAACEPKPSVAIASSKSS